MQLYMPTRVYSEENCVLAHAAELRAQGKKAMIVTGHRSAKATGALQDVVQALGETPYVIFDRIEENPSVETVMEARAAAIAEQVDFCIGIGGGSPMDAAKAIALMAANPDETAEVLYESRALPHLPVVCVPTTCGTGSEVTPYSILTRHTHQTKRSISHRIFPVLALMDAKYLQHLSRSGLVNTCVDALGHLFESYLNTNANELNILYARRGLRLWAQFRDRLFTIRVEGNVYIVEGNWIKNVVESTNLEDYESASYFQRIIRKKGLIDALVKKGIKENDTVKIYDIEFDYVE